MFWSSATAYFLLAIKLELFNCQQNLPLIQIKLNSSNAMRFKHSNSSNYSNMLIINNYLYFTGTDYVFSLNALRINCNESANAQCGYKERLVKATNTNEDKQSSEKNFIKFLAFREHVSDLIVCGTNLGRPHVYDLKKSDLSNQLEYNGDFICPSISGPNNLNLISFSQGIFDVRQTKKGIMYSAVWLTEKKSNELGIFSRYGIFRKAIEVNKYFVRSIFSPLWLWEPNFIGIIEDKKYVYYFFNEISVERNYEFTKSWNHADTSNQEIKDKISLTRFSRVARVCKNDMGVKVSEKWKQMWTSFRKIRLRCDCTNHSFEASFNNLVLMKRLPKSGSKLLLIFHELIPGASSEISSVLCEFDLNSIREKLETKLFWANNSNKTHDNYECIDEIDQTDPNDNEYDESFYDFLSENTILDATAVGECKIILPFKITSFDIISERTGQLIHLATSFGKLVRLVITESKVYKLLSVFDLNEITKKASNIIEVLINKSIQSIVYLTTNDSVIQINLSNFSESICKGHLFCSECQGDPLCVWKNSECVPNLNNDIKRSCLDLKMFERNLKMNFSLSVMEGESLAIKCFVNNNEMFLINNYMLLDRIKWYRNGIALASKLWRLGSNAELIIFNTQKEDSGVFTCRYDSHLMSVVYLTIKNRKIIPSNSLLTETELKDEYNKSMNSITEVIDEWKMEIKQYKLKMKDFDNYLNCSINCDC